MRNFIEISRTRHSYQTLGLTRRNTIENVLSNVLSCIVLLHKCHQRVCGVCMLHEIKRPEAYDTLHVDPMGNLWGNHTLIQDTRSLKSKAPNALTRASA